MNRLNRAERAQIIAALVEGNSLRATVRLTGFAMNTILKLLRELGAACDAYQDKHLRNLSCKRIEADEIWSFVYAKAKNVPADKAAEFGYGDVWTFTAIDADTKLIPSWMVGPREIPTARLFMQDVASRLANRVQLTTDGHRMYLEAVERSFGKEIDFAQLVKVYGTADEFGTAHRYSQPECTGIDVHIRQGNPDPKHISTSYVERHNLTMRMAMRRFTRLTNAFSKKVENHAAAVALHTMHYNFARPHRSLGKLRTPAMAAGVSDHVWTCEEIAALLD